MTTAAGQLIPIYESRHSRIYHQPVSPYGIPVAIKVSASDYPTSSHVIRLKNEYEFTRDPGISGVRRAIDQIQFGDRPALVMEYVEGQTLAQVFVAQRQPLADFLTASIEIAGIIAEVHQRRIIHMDINSRNLLIDARTKRIMLIDFDLASRLDSLTTYPGNPEMLPGTLEYISPEQTGRMNRMVDYRTDLYSLGVTFYEMLTGRLPFESDDPLTLVHAHMARTPRPVSSLNPDVPQLLSDMVMKLMAKNAEDRYQSALGLKADLEKCRDFLQDSGRGASAAAPQFELGLQDHSGKFSIPQKLYGRSNEVAALMAAFDRAAAGSQELLLVTGRGGVGKSALVAEIHKPVTRENGYFIRGKFDQYQQSQPYAAFTQIFDEFVDLLLSGSKASLEQWRDRILSAVNGNGAVLTEVMPNLEKIIGRQPAVQKLGGAENRNRFHLTFRNFVKAISTAEHPLVVFIDDWQWADRASLELFKVLLTGERIAHLLLIGAYRDNELDRLHPLKMTLDSLAGFGVTVRNIFLDNLGQRDVQQLIEESLFPSSGESPVLTELVYRKTRGNAFFTRQFLHSLYQEGWLRFDFSSCCWKWDIARIEAQNITDNVIDLMAAKLRRLSPETARLLQLAACIGNEFDLATLALIDGASGPASLDSLSEALAEGLLIPLDSYYKLPDTAILARFSFLHDRVQQAAYAQIRLADRQAVHLEIGRLLLANISEEELNQKVFSIVQHFNHSGPLIAETAERVMVADLNLKAADLAYAAAAFQSARENLETALSFMSSDAWTGRYDLMLRLHSELATVLSLTGDFEQLERIFHAVETHAHSMAETAQAKEAKIQSLLYNGHYAEAIDLGLKFIEAMGISIKRDISQDEAFDYLRETADWLTEERIEGLMSLHEAPADIALILEIASVINGPLYNSNMHLLFVFVSRITRLCIEQGLTPWAPVTLITFTILLCAGLHDIPKARLLATTTMQLFEKRYPSDDPVSPLSLVFGGFLIHRYDHLKNTIPVFAEGVQKGLGTGNFQFTGYCAWWQAWHLLFAGVDLREVEAICVQTEETCIKTQMCRLHEWGSLVRQVVLNMQGKSAVPWVIKGDAYDEHERLPAAFQIDDFADVFRIFFYKGWLHYMFGLSERAVEFFREAESYLLYGAGSYFIPLFYFYDTLAHAALAERLTTGDLSAILRRMDLNLAQLEVWDHFAPMNHRHKKNLMEAEKARLEGRYWEAVALYENAIEGARENEFLNEEALACELYGRFWKERGRAEAARAFLSKAHGAYKSWGALAKAAQLAGEYGLSGGKEWSPDVAHTVEPMQQADNVASADWLDLYSLLKAGQTLSQAVQLPDLLGEMSRILLENAGAQRGLVMCRDEGEWFIRARCRVQDTAIQTDLRLPLSERSDISSSIFNYVVHSGKAVVLGNASRDPQFSSDPYLRENKIKSVLCLPISHKGEFNLVLYLENNLTECAFTENRLEFLQLLSGQMAISLENALMYETLRTSVAERERAEQTLKESEERLRMALEGTSDGIWDWNLQTGQVYFSPRYYTMIGYQPNEFPPCYESWRERVHPDDVEQAERALQRTIEERTLYSTEFRFRTGSGDWRWTLSRGKVVEFDPEGKALRLAGSHTDISKRKRAEEALEKRIVALTQPMDSTQGIAFEDLFNLSDLQHLQNLFADVFGVAALMTQPDGTPITRPSNFSYLCAIIRSTAKGTENCKRSDAWVGRYNPTGPNIGNCLGIGLCSAGASITAGGRHIANWIIGQVRNETWNEKEVLAYAREIGADETALLDAYREIPTMPQEQFYRLAHVLFAFANQLSTTAYQNIQQARFIADRKKSEESLRKYERIVSTSQDLIALLNRDYVYEAVNESLLDAHKKTREEIVGRNVAELFGESVFREVIKPRFDQALCGRTMHFQMTHNYAGTGRRTMDIAYFPVFDETGKVTGIVLNARDVTETRKLEEQLIQTQKIESIGTLAGGVAHEINNPINGIMNYAQLILDRVGADSPAMEFAQEILNETERVSKIVKNLLTFARHEKQSHSPAHLEDLLSAVLSLINTVMRHDQITLKLDIPKSLPKFKCRSQQIQQVLMNLVTNARDTLNERYPGYDRDKVLRISARLIMKDDARFIRTTVEDTGMGIPAEIMDRIFDPFFTTKPKESGTGLGLSISYGIVKGHHGELMVESEPGRFTRFHMDLPVDNGWTLVEH